MQNLMPPIESLDNLFHDGNPLTGEQGTIVSAKWLNDVQKAIRNNQSEILSILKAAGINVNESNQAQLLDAVKKVIAGEITGKANSNHTHDFPVQSVNSKTGQIILTAKDISPVLPYEQENGLVIDSSNLANYSTPKYVGMQIANNRGGASAIAFTRTGYYGCYFGINSNNDFTFGEFNPIATYRFVTEKNQMEFFPVGCPQPWPQSIPPAGWLVCDGSAFNRNNYPLLVKAYPAGVLPDLRGEFIRGWDSGRGVDIDREIMSSQSCGIQTHKHNSVMWNGVPAVNSYAPGFPTTGTQYHLDFKVASDGNINMTSDTGINETRPRNIAFLYIVRAA